MYYIFYPLIAVLGIAIMLYDCKSKNLGRGFVVGAITIWILLLSFATWHQYRMESQGYTLQWSNSNFRFIYADKEGRAAP
jgi:hypothetical protein